MTLSIIVPAHNEEENIADAIDRIEAAVGIAHELVVVNDHSTDKTRHLVEGLGSRYNNIKLVDNQLENGFANALRAGFREANGDVLIPVMADLCDDLSTVGKLFEKIDQGYDIACGCRYTKEGARLGGSRIKGILSCFAGHSLHLLLGIPTHDIANAFKMYRRHVLESIDIKAKGFEISMEIPLKAYYLGFKITEVPTLWKERSKGKSNFRILKLLPSYIRLYFWALKKRFSL